MSIYQMMNGVSPATFFFLPMLGKHPDEYPRFRDCFLNDEEHPEYSKRLHIYTRTGGGNREAYEEANDAMRASPYFITDFDDSFDSTYASWIFRVPDQWQADYQLLMDSKPTEVSDAYVDIVCKVFPKIDVKLRDLFRSK